MWYIMTPPQPVTVSIDVPQDRASVYAYLDVMANHEHFTDHMLTNWRVSGPADRHRLQGQRHRQGRRASPTSPRSRSSRSRTAA